MIPGDPARVMGGTAADEAGLVGVGAAHHARGIAWDHAHAREDDDADHGEGDRGDGETLDEIVEHGASGRRRVGPRLVRWPTSAYCQDTPLMRMRPSGTAL